MDTAATLAFFQNFYTDAALYVVAERATPPDPAAGPPTPVVGRPAVEVPVPVAATGTSNGQVLPSDIPAAAPPPMPAPQPVPVRPAGEGALPVVAPVPAPLPPAPTPLPPAPPATAPQPLGTLALAQLPAAAAAPAGRVQPTPTQSPVAHIPFATLGSNAQGLVILVRVSPEQFRKLPRNVFLNNLLKALRLVMEDVVLVNVEHEKFPVALCSLRQHLAARQFLAFGKNLLDVAVYTTQPYEPVLLYGDTAFLGASEIEMLEYDAGRKKQLWQAVQRMFA